MACSKFLLKLYYVFNTETSDHIPWYWNFVRCCSSWSLRFLRHEANFLSEIKMAVSRTLPYEVAFFWRYLFAINRNMNKSSLERGRDMIQIKIRLSSLPFFICCKITQIEVCKSLSTSYSNVVVCDSTASFYRLFVQL